MRLGTTEIMLIVGYIVIGVIFGLITKGMNEQKGYDGGFWWGFILTIIGIIVVAVRPFNQKHEKDDEKKKAEAEELQEIKKSVDSLNEQVKDLNAALSYLIQQQAQQASENQQLLKQANENTGRRRRTLSDQ